MEVLTMTAYHQLTPASERVARLERLHRDLVQRFGAQHSLARRVAQQLGNAKVVAHVGEEAGR